MSKDLKIGMIIGVFLLIAATLVISFLSEGSLRGRLKSKFKKETAAPSPGNTDNQKYPLAQKTAEDETPESTGNIHTVTEGQTIKDIAEKYYGNRMMINKIVDENPNIPDNYELKPGMKLKIPR